MSRKRVLQLVTLSEAGGAQKVVYHLASGLEPERFDVTVACAPGGELINWLKNLKHVKVVELDLLKRSISFINDLRCFFRLYSMIRARKYDIVHCHSSKAGIIGRLAARVAGVRQIYFTVHGWGIDESQPLPVRFVYTLAERLAGAVSTGVVCVSRYDYEKGLALRLVAAERLTVIYNGVPDEWGGGQSLGGAGVLRVELGLGPGDTLVGAVMRLAAPKNPIMFLEVAKRLLSRHSGLYFAVVGDGPLRTLCENYIVEHGLWGRVFLLGTRENAAQLVGEFDVFTLFSDHEGLPLTVIEAMLASVPVVASNVGGVGEMVAHGETGYLVDGPDAALSYIDELLRNPAARSRMGAAGRKRALQMFNLENMIKGYLDLYCEIN